MRIRNANIYTEEHRFVRGDAAVENGRFVSCTGDPAGEEAVVDAEGMYLIPGLVDIHFHGCKGADMCDGTKEALDVITSYAVSYTHLMLTECMENAVVCRLGGDEFLFYLPAASEAEMSMRIRKLFDSFGAAKNVTCLLYTSRCV